MITGTSENGLGAQTAVDLARGNPSHIYLLARSIEKVQPVINQLTVKATFVPLELDKLSSVKAAAKAINAKIDILINNAGVMAIPYSTNELGIERTVAINHIGHFYLTKLLIPNLQVQGRIINLSSDGYKICPFQSEDPGFSNGSRYNPWAAYGQSKTANILFSTALARRGVTSFSVHPGVISSTSLSNHLSDFSRQVKDIQETALAYTGVPFQVGRVKTLEQGVSTTVRAALDPSLETSSGAFLQDCQIMPAWEYATSAEMAERLWQWSEDIIGEKFVLT